MDQIAAYCRRWKIKELALFGSVLTERFRPDSDVDVLVTFAPDSGWTLFDFVRAERELSTIVGRQVDLVDRRAIERNRNPFITQSILQSAQIVYVA